MDKTKTLRAMMLVAGGLTAAVAVPGVAVASCCGAYRQPAGGGDGQIGSFNRETTEQREARLARAQARREARIAARAEAQAARAAVQAERQRVAAAAVIPAEQSGGARP